MGLFTAYILNWMLLINFSSWMFFLIVRWNIRLSALNLHIIRKIISNCICDISRVISVDSCNLMLKIFFFHPFILDLFLIQKLCRCFFLMIGMCLRHMPAKSSGPRKDSHTYLTSKSDYVLYICNSIHLHELFLNLDRCLQLLHQNLRKTLILPPFVNAQIRINDIKLSLHSGFFWVTYRFETLNFSEWHDLCSRVLAIFFLSSSIQRNADKIQDYLLA